MENYGKNRPIDAVKGTLRYQAARIIQFLSLVLGLSIG